MSTARTQAAIGEDQIHPVGTTDASFLAESYYTRILDQRRTFELGSI